MPGAYKGRVQYPPGRAALDGEPMRTVSVQCHEGRCADCPDTLPDDEPYSGPLAGGPLDGLWCEHGCGHPAMPRRGGG